MARGPDPSPQRRRRNVPARGDWVELEPVAKPTLPPVRRGWSDRVKRLWRAWRADPVTSTYTAADIAWAVELANVFEQLPAGEQRLRMDGLGLTPKGKRDLRLRVASRAEASSQRPVPSLPQLRAV